MTIEGLDTDAVGDWLNQTAPGLLTGPLNARLITGGKSNLTYTVTDGSTEVVVRRPPLGHVLATAHDMSREYRVMQALADSDVPVPQMFALCEDDSVTGAPFYVMELVSGTAYQHAAELERLGADRTHAISERVVDTLAALHAVDPAAVGLGDFGRPDGYLERQVQRWRKQLDSSRSRDIAGIDELAERLSAAIPASHRVAIVHGDYRLDNALVDDKDVITAVLDWEMSTLGDPLSDVALMLTYDRLAQDARDSPVPIPITDAPLAPGYLTAEETLQRYTEQSGHDVADFSWHQGLAFFKLAVILEGIHFRFSQGKTVGEGFDGIGDAVEPLVRAGLQATA